MFDAEITKAVKNKKKKKNKMDKRETYRLHLPTLGICYFRLEEKYVIYVRFTSERIIMY